MFGFGEKLGILGLRSEIIIADWWFQTFFIFHNMWDNPFH